MYYESDDYTNYDTLLSDYVWKPIFHSSALSKTLNEKLYLMWQVSKSVDEYEGMERMELNK